MNKSYSYEVFGLRISSEIELPELFPTSKGMAFDVQIALGATSNPGEPGVRSIADGATLTIEGVAQYVIIAGDRIIVCPVSGTPERNVRLYLLGTAFGLLLHQRGYVPLHANAIDLGGEAVAFMGRSGAGKSTLAAWFHDQGNSILADDVCVVRFGSGDEPLVMPGLPRFRLWKDAIELSGRDSAEYSRSYSGESEYDKYDVPVANDQASRSPVRLRAVYLLETGNEFEIAGLAGVQAIEALFENTYRGAYIATVGDPQRHWETCIQLLATVRVFVARRTLDLSKFEQETQGIRRHAMDIIGVE